MPEEERMPASFSFASFCRNHLNIKFIDGLKMFFPSNKYIKDIPSNIESLISESETNSSEELNNCIPHLIYINKNMSSFLEDKFNTLDETYKATLVKNNIVFADRRRDGLLPFLGTTRAFIGTYIKYAPTGSNITNVMFANIAKFETPGDIIAEHLWVRYPRMYKIPYKNGKAYKFVGEIYRYTRKSESGKFLGTNYDYSIKSEYV